MEHEHPLHADALKNAAHGDRLVHPAVALGDHHPFVGLNTFFVALADADAHTNGVAHVNLRQIAFHLLGFEGLDQGFGAELLCWACRSTCHGLHLSHSLRCGFGAFFRHRRVLRIGCHPSSALNRQTISVPSDASDQ